jgi:transposase
VRKRRLRQGSAKATALRLVSTGHSILADRVKTMDETPIKAGRNAHGRMKIAYFWPVYGEHDEICFPFFPSREGENVVRILGKTHAPGSVLLTDGYGVYSSYAKQYGLIHAQC